MKSERQSNFESMRIVCIFMVVVYHFVLYNGIFATEYNAKTLLGLIFTSGGAIAADYAFICVSAYFLLEMKKKPILKRFFSTGFQILTMYLLRLIVIRGLYGFHTNNIFLEDMIMKGAWWFGYCYLILLLIYPILNKIIDLIPLAWLLLICGILGIWVCVNWISDRVNLFHDMVMFLFVYFSMGFMKRKKYKTFLGFKNRRRTFVLIYLLCYLLVFATCISLKNNVRLDAETSGILVTRLVGKYFILQAVMGFCVFFLFRHIQMRYHLWINRISKATFFIFLMHETVMGVFWRFGFANGNTLMYCSIKTFLLWLIIYIICCYIVGGVIYLIYEKTVQPLIDKAIDVLNQTRFIRRIEELYQKIS